ncbi:hypothetical protein A165_12770 [Vibrio tasmaniensis ZS-17]|uniref:hypothetical protein n=1 Tax=Vibrio tasmaniensis TaxID=212663 RepID=UPI0002E93F34|nr:hypothetical protein [Vibrio tasmaniensis]OED62454.1 hypothetical protein A165_12770 [Vibrio tasmaniensis ZS-17]
MQVSDPIHLPCPDMAGMTNPDSKKLQRSQVLIQKLREKHGIKKRVKLPSQPLNFICTERGCIEPWGATNNAGGELDEN